MTPCLAHPSDGATLAREAADGTGRQTLAGAQRVAAAETGFTRG